MGLTQYYAISTDHFSENCQPSPLISNADLKTEIGKFGFEHHSL